jgi:peptidoglycan hydrolase-like protein with peptidoglycan-binding domain
MFKGTDIIEIARQHIGEDYILGAIAPLANTKHTGPWDCAEFASWCAYQAYAIIYAVRPPDPRLGESYSGWWYEDAKTVGRQISVDEALITPGAILCRKPRRSGSPRIGHVAISLGNGSTIEAKDRATGVAEVDGARNRLWDRGVCIPGVEYSSSRSRVRLAPLTAPLVLDDPFRRGPDVAALQNALAAAGVEPGGIDGVFGHLTYAAVANFQARAGLVPDGWVGPETARSLDLDWPISATAENAVEFETASARSSVVAVRDASFNEIEDARPPNADPSTTERGTPVGFSFETSGRKIFAIPSTGSKFYIGYSVSYTDDMTRRGLAQKVGDLTSPEKYDRAIAANRFGKWAHFLWPTIVAESDGYYGRVNSYDRAAFTFGCYQFAAHTPAENLILLFRRLLALQSAKSYFPDLTLAQRVDGQVTVHREADDGTLRDLENAKMVTRPNGVREKQIPYFMSYLNSDPVSVDKAEQIATARLMLWCEEDEAARMAQIELAIETAKKKLRATKAEIPGLDLTDWRIALWVNDIRHQGRAGYAAIRGALQKPDPVDALSKLGSATYDERKRSVRASIATLTDEKVLNGWQPDLT